MIGSSGQGQRMFYKLLLHVLREESFAESLAHHLLRNAAPVSSLASPLHSDPSATLPLSLLIKGNKDCNGYIISVLN